MIAIVGVKGGMGRRYKAILDFLGVKTSLYDVDNWGQVSSQVELDGIIIASPTDCHYDNLKELKHLNVPILCEKPITKDSLQLKEILEWDFTLTMVNQYSYMIDVQTTGETSYDYYNTGRDGLKWDCINISGLAKEQVVIYDNSPIWKCKLNGKELSIKDMDQAYIDMIEDWLSKPNSNKGYIKKAHDIIFEGSNDKRINSNTSKIDKQKTSRQEQHGHKRKDNVGMGHQSVSKVSSLYKQR